MARDLPLIFAKGPIPANPLRCLEVHFRRSAVAQGLVNPPVAVEAEAARQRTLRLPGARVILQVQLVDLPHQGEVLRRLPRGFVIPRRTRQPDQ